MPQVNVTIAGKAYRMACGEGEEPHLEALAQFYDGKIEEMRQAFGEIGDMRLHVMAALMVADELSELKRKVETLEGRLQSLQGDAGFADQRAGEIEERRRPPSSPRPNASKVWRRACCLGRWADMSAPRATISLPPLQFLNHA